MRIIGEGGQRIRVEKENVKYENGSDSIARVQRTDAIVLVDSSNDTRRVTSKEGHTAYLAVLQCHPHNEQAERLEV